jgi:hypothetical protein
MDKYRRTVNCNPDREDNMALNFQYPKETHCIHREVGTGLESSMASGTAILERRGEGWSRMKAWNEVKGMAVDKIWWERFTDDLCCRRSNRN